VAVLLPPKAELFAEPLDVAQLHRTTTTATLQSQPRIPFA
jgi:hypothetical protein